MTNEAPLTDEQILDITRAAGTGTPNPVDTTAGAALYAERCRWAADLAEAGIRLVPAWDDLDD